LGVSIGGPPATAQLASANMTAILNPEKDCREIMIIFESILVGGPSVRFHLDSTGPTMIKARTGASPGPHSLPIVHSPFSHKLTDHQKSKAHTIVNVLRLTHVGWMLGDLTKDDQSIE
jgi:hypothetical protein